MVNPSETTDAYWLQAVRQTGTYPQHTANGGKWLIFVDVAGVDELWEAIERATGEGKLGSMAKVSTAKPNPNAKDPNQRVICVYTYDWTDEEDVRQIRRALRELGVTQKIPYKADSDTLAGKYAKRGHRRISKYYE